MRERVTVVLDDFVKFAGESGGFFVGKFNVHRPRYGVGIARREACRLPFIGSPVEMIASYDTKFGPSEPGDLTWTRWEQPAASC
jgi:hypothetical protein